MSNEYEINRVILVSRCGFDTKTRFDGALDEFMDLSAEHLAYDNKNRSAGVEADVVGNGHWLIVKNKVRMINPPKVFSSVKLKTWLRQAEGAKSYREFGMFNGDELLVVGKTEIALVDNKTLKKITDPKYYRLKDAKPCQYICEDFESVKLNLTGDPIGTYKVQSSDIDFLRHMNNCAYVRAFQNLFTLKEWKEMKITDMEIHYIRPTLEGETLEFRKKTENNKNYYQISSGAEIKAIIITY